MIKCIKYTSKHRASSEMENQNLFFITEGISCTDNGSFPRRGFDMTSGEGRIELYRQDIISNNSRPMWLGEKRDL